MDVVDIVGKDEAVLKVVRKHWTYIMPLMVCFGVLSLTALYGLYLLVNNSDSFARVGSPGLAGLALAAAAVFGVLLAYVSWIVYWENRLIITTENLYKVTKYSLFSEVISELNLLRMEDVTASQNGIVASTLGYGNVMVETAGEEENFIFRQVPDPHAVARAIMTEHRKARKKRGAEAEED